MARTPSPAGSPEPLAPPGAPPACTQTPVGECSPNALAVTPRPLPQWTRPMPCANMTWVSAQGQPTAHQLHKTLCLPCPHPPHLQTLGSTARHGQSGREGDKAPPYRGGRCCREGHGSERQRVRPAPRPTRGQAARRGPTPPQTPPPGHRPAPATATSRVHVPALHQHEATLHGDTVRSPQNLQAPPCPTPTARPERKAS